MVVNPNQDNGDVKVRHIKQFRKYIGDTLGDRNVILFLTGKPDIKETEVDAFIGKASEYGFTFCEIDFNY